MQSPPARVAGLRFGPRSYQTGRVIAPSAADPTLAAYFAITPRL